MTNNDNLPKADHDSPWKMALDAYFNEFLDLLFPDIHKEVDWSQGYIPFWIKSCSKSHRTPTVADVTLIS